MLTLAEFDSAKFYFGTLCGRKHILDFCDRSLRYLKMTGEKDLNTLFQSMQPKLIDEEYVFCSVPIEQLATLNVTAICQFREVEGMTLILTKHQAEKAQLSYELVWRMITLLVHSSLEAVGFLAAITNKLAEQSISANAVSAYYHDYLFVPANKAEQAMHILKEMSK